MTYREWLTQALPKAGIPEDATGDYVLTGDQERKLHKLLQKETGQFVVHIGLRNELTIGGFLQMLEML